MVTLKRYLNLSQAGLAKTFLEDHNISCALLDQNAHLYAFAYLAIPVRLVVSDAQLERAARVLSHSQRLLVLDQEGSSPVPFDEREIADLDEKTIAETEQEESGGTSASNNPWEILAIGYLFLVPGLGFLLEWRPLILQVNKVYRNRSNAFLIFSSVELHAVGSLLITAALLLVLFYFYVRRVIALNNANSVTASPPQSE
jgi:putative signal transducing protein